MPAYTWNSANEIFIGLAVKHYRVEGLRNRHIIWFFHFKHRMGPGMKFGPHTKQAAVALHGHLGTIAVGSESLQPLFHHKTCACLGKPQVMTVHDTYEVQCSLHQLQHCWQHNPVTILWLTAAHLQKKTPETSRPESHQPLFHQDMERHWLL